eukprot:8783851-Lingulodinium_polyedra.AAC.1
MIPKFQETDEAERLLGFMVDLETYRVVRYCVVFPSELLVAWLRVQCCQLQQQQFKLHRQGVHHGE